MPSIQDKILEAQRLAASQDGNAKPWSQADRTRNDHATPSQPGQQQMDQPPMQQQQPPQMFGYDMYNQQYNQMMMQHQFNPMGMPMGQMVPVDPNMQNPGMNWQNQAMLLANQAGPSQAPHSPGSQAHLNPQGQMGSQSPPMNQPGGTMIQSGPSSLQSQQSPMQQQPQFSSPEFKGKGKFAPSQPPPQEAAPGAAPNMPNAMAPHMHPGGKGMGSQPSQASIGSAPSSQMQSGQMQGQMMGMMSMMPGQGMMIPSQHGQYGVPPQMMMMPQHMMMQPMPTFDESGISNVRDDKHGVPQRSGRYIPQQQMRTGRKDISLPDDMQSQGFGGRRVRDPTRESWADVTDSPKGVSDNIVLDFDKHTFKGKGKAGKGKNRMFFPQGPTQPMGFQGPDRSMIDFADDRKLGMDDRNLRKSLLEKQDMKGNKGIASATSSMSQQTGQMPQMPQISGEMPLRGQSTTPIRTDDWGGKGAKHLDKGQKLGRDFGKAKHSGKGGKFDDAMNKGSSKGKGKGFGGAKSVGGKFDTSPRNGRRKDRELTEWFSLRMGSGPDESSGSQPQGRESKGKSRGQWMAKTSADDDLGEDSVPQWKPKADSDEERDGQEGRSKQQVKTEARSSRQKETAKRSDLSTTSTEGIEKRLSGASKSARKKETWTRKSK